MRLLPPSRLQLHCHQVLFNQLISWLAHGVLMDPHHEFFIQSTASVDDEASHASPADHPSRSAHHERGVHRVADSVAAEHAWNTRYTVNAAMLPVRYFPLRVAEKVLFIGKAVQLLRHPMEVARVQTKGARRGSHHVACRHDVWLDTPPLHRLAHARGRRHAIR